MAKKKITVGELVNEPISKKLSKNLKYSLEDIDELLGFKGEADSIKWKPNRYLIVDEAIEKAVNRKGFIQLGHSHMVLGMSDTGKSQFLNKCAIACQKENILPIFIITEFKFSFNHLINMGFEAQEEVDEETGEVSYGGDYIFRDASTLLSIEDIAKFMMNCIDLQRKGKIKRDICFLVDTFGNSQCIKSIESKQSNAMWDAQAMNQQFHKGVTREISLTRKSTHPFTTTLVALNHAWTNNRIGEYMSPPTLEPAYGMGLYKGCTAVLQMGDVTKQGISIVKATKSGKDYDFGKRIKVQLRKWHGDETTVRAKVIIVDEGFIEDTKEAVAEYVKEHSKKWVKNMGLDSNTEITMKDVAYDEDDD